MVIYHNGKIYITQEDLQHHGILGMHWGVRRYQPYPKGDKKGKEVGEAKKVQQRTDKAYSKLQKIQKKSTKKQNKANKYYMKANRSSTGIIQNRKAAGKAYAKATKYQQKVLKLDNKGAKYYQKKKKQFDKMKIDANPEFSKIGENFVESVKRNNQQLLMTQLSARFA